MGQNSRLKKPARILKIANSRLIGRNNLLRNQVQEKFKTVQLYKKK